MSVLFYLFDLCKFLVRATQKLGICAPSAFVFLRYLINDIHKWFILPIMLFAA